MELLGAEWADRITSVAAERPALIDQIDDNRCAVCEAPGTACTHASIRAAAAAMPPRPDTRETVMARARQQTRIDQPQPPVGVPQPHTEVPVVEITEPPQTPAEGAQSAGDDIADPPRSDATVPIVTGEGHDPDVMQLSRIEPTPATATPAADAAGHAAAAVAAAAAAAAAEVATPPLRMLPDGDPAEVRDVVVVPADCIDPRTDPCRPRDGVLVNEHGDWPLTGAWMTSPHNSRWVLFTHDVHRVQFSQTSPTPQYFLVGRRGHSRPRPRT